MQTIDTRKIFLNATPKEVFNYIEDMPSKFPTFRLFDTQLFLILRISLVDGIRSGIKSASDKKYRKELQQKDAEPLKPGSSFGFFKLTQIDRPNKYYFKINSYFFKGETGYIIKPNGNNTILYFDCNAENPDIKQKIWWYIIKPIHIILAKLVLRNIKKGINTKLSTKTRTIHC